MGEDFIMNICKNTRRFTLIASATLAALSGLSGTARADDITPDPYTHMVSTRTRAEVVAELHAARASGSMAQAHAEDGGSFQLARQAWASGRTRAEVHAEVLAARRSGETAAMTGEDSGSAYLARLRQLQPMPDGTRMAAVAR